MAKTSTASKASTPKSTETPQGSTKAGTSHLSQGPVAQEDVKPETSTDSVASRDLPGG